ncbi:hypothetical protein IQ225_01665 [Synechocystis salina LEGE 06155]|nr:hypothetical protein [Synechocystis salina LEGE 06155]
MAVFSCYLKVTSDPVRCFLTTTARYKNMTTATLASASNSDSAIWDSLKLAIADSSGFKCWQDDNGEAVVSKTETVAPPPLDAQVRHYLRQTLETLAY